MIGERFDECIVEFSYTENKFYISVYEISCDKYHTIQLFKKQSSKLLKACDNSYESLMKILDFNKHGKLYIKHFD